MHRVAHGDVDAFETLHERHATAAFSLALRMLHDRRGAEDVCQEAFLALWRRAGSFDAARGSAGPWLLGIVRNRAIDALRHRATHTRRLDMRAELLEEEPARERTDVQAIGNIQAQAARSALASLPTEQRQAITLAYYGGLSHREIAETLGQPLGTIKGRVRLGLGKLHRATISGCV